MSGSASLALRKALFDYLSAAPSLSPALGTPARILDEADGEPLFPYVTLGDDLSSDWSTASERGTEHFVSLSVWSRHGGRAEAIEIMGLIRDVLDDAAFPLTGHRIVSWRFEQSRTMRDEDGETYRGLIRFRVRTEPL